MQPRPVTDEDAVMFRGVKRVFRCPPEITNCQSIETVAEGELVHVPWIPDEIELMHLATGGTIWLTQWGGLAPHIVRIIPKMGGS